MDEHGLHEVIDQVMAGHLSRRAFVRAMTALGLTAPMAAGMLASASGAHRNRPSRRPGAAVAAPCASSGGRHRPC